MAKKLIDEGIPAVDLQGNLSQKQRDRNLLAFEKGLVRVWLPPTWPLAASTSMM